MTTNRTNSSDSFISPVHRATGFDARRVLGLLLALAGACIAHAVEAQSRAASADELQEITVTATRQVTTVQTTPTTISAFTSDHIAEKGITDVDSLVRLVPDIAIRDTGGPGEVEYEIRGLNSQGGSSSMVGLYFGEVPLSTATGAQVGKTSQNPSLYDMERVEVLSGPQGTLYGSSSMGGTIRLDPHPGEAKHVCGHFRGDHIRTASGGGFNQQLNGMINLPLGGTAAVRVVGSFLNGSGWVHRTVIADGAVSVDPGGFPAVSRPSNFYTAPTQLILNGVNTTQISSVRAQFLWQPLANLTIEPAAFYQEIKQGGPPSVDVNGNPTHPQMPSTWTHYEIYDSPETQQDSLTFGSLTMVYHAPAFSITSATGIWHRNFLNLQDDTEQVASAVGIPVYDSAGGGLGPQVSFRGPGNLEQDATQQISEEVRFTSTTQGPFQWVAGYFYQDLHSDTNVSALAPQASAIFGGPNESLNWVPTVLVQNAGYANISWRSRPNSKRRPEFGITTSA